MQRTTRLLLVTKRHFMGKDIITQAYGRQYELARHMAASGWDVKGYCLDYRSRWGREDLNSAGVRWKSYAAPVLWRSWSRDIRREVRAWKPDIVLGCSDPLHITFAHRARDRAASRFVVDLHDNLESQGFIRLPGFRRKLARAVREADLVSCVSEPLAGKITNEYSPRGTVVVLENAVPDEFRRGRMDIVSSRLRHGLPLDDPVVGVAGALYGRRGMETILDGFRLLRSRIPELVLALAGPTDLEPSRFAEQEGVRYLGILDYESVPSFLSALDVGLVPNIRPAFAEYCYPQKAVELCALSIPIVAANFGVMRTLAADQPQALYRADDPADLARAVEYQLANRRTLSVIPKSWGQQADMLRQFLCEIMEPRR